MRPKTSEDVPPRQQNNLRKNGSNISLRSFGGIRKCQENSRTCFTESCESTKKKFATNKIEASKKCDDDHYDNHDDHYDHNDAHYNNNDDHYDHYDDHYNYYNNNDDHYNYNDDHYDNNNYYYYYEALEKCDEMNDVRRNVIMDVHEIDGDDVPEEVAPVRRFEIIIMPRQDEVDEHNITHLPFRSWCPHSAQGRGVSADHRKRVKEENEVPVTIRGFKEREPDEHAYPIILLTDRRTKMKFAYVVPKKGIDHYGVEQTAKDIVKILGYEKFVFQSDQEPAMLRFKDAVRRQVMSYGAVEGQIIMEESPVGDSQNSCDVESRIKQVTGLFRTSRSYVQTKYKCVIPENHNILPWMVMHSANTLNRFNVGKDGKTPRYRLKQRDFKEKHFDFAECCWYSKPKSKGIDKMNLRWIKGIFLGILENSGELILGTTEGIIKVRTMRKSLRRTVVA